MKTKFKDVTSYITFPASISVLSVEGTRLIGDAMISTDIIPHSQRVLDHPLQIGIASAMLGVGVGNVYMNDHSSKNITHAMRAMMAGMFVDIGTAGGAMSPYIVAFATAAAGLYMRRHISLGDNPKNPGQGPR